MKVSGIYMIQSISKPERVYVGSAMNIRMRWATHMSDLRLNKHRSPQLQRHFNAYGEQDMVFEVIESGDYINKNHLLSREQGWFIPYSFGGINKPYFNTMPTAGSQLGFKHSAVSIQKMKDHSAMKGKKLPPRSEEYTQNQREAHLGQKAWNKGIPHSVEVRKKCGVVNIGNTYCLGIIRSEEEKQKNREAHLGKPSSSRGVKRSEETCRRIRESKKLLIFQYDLNMNFVREWNSPISAARGLGINSGSISHCLREDSKTGGGFIWKYKIDKRVA
jgi:group I intron endonuclease